MSSVRTVVRSRTGEHCVVRALRRACGGRSRVRRRLVRGLAALAGCLAAVWCPTLWAQEVVLTEDGRPRARIVVAASPPRLTALAARELQAYVRRLSGAELPIVTSPDASVPVHVYVGRSEFTDRLGITDEGLAHDAFRIVSAPGHVVLLGHDADFEPKEPWPHGPDDVPRAQKDWERMSGGWGLNPMSAYSGPIGGFNGELKIWKQDRGGSLQAVYEFLRRQGVRWYLPGALGEVVPERKSIRFPVGEQTVRPDSALRNLHWYSRFPRATRDDVLWWLRLGLNDGSSLLGLSYHTHGMRGIQGDERLKRQHPEYYALYGGKRETDFYGVGHACFSSPGLLEATVEYLRAAFDHFDEPAMDLWPNDAYHPCECELCIDRQPSDLVFGFLDRVARELLKSHPDRLITGGAYTPYHLPPAGIERFPPNVAVFLTSQARPSLADESEWQAHRKWIESWRAKLAPGHLLRVENDLYDLEMMIHPRGIARDLRALRGISLGDFNEVARPNAGDARSQWAHPGVNHLNYYVNARFLWDADQDVEPLLEEYFPLFYGPAAEKMREAFGLAEAECTRTGRELSLPARVRFVELLHAARAAAGDSVHGARIDLILGELEPLDSLQASLRAQTEAPDPRARAAVAVAQALPTADERRSFPLVDAVTGEAAAIPSTFLVGWEKNVLVFDVRCQEPDMEHLFVTSDVWGGDSVAILLESPFHSYYQIEVNPDGRLYDADRKPRGSGESWESLAKVEAERGKDFWRVVVRVPVVPEREGSMDPLHNVVGDKPTAGAPWFFNVGRVRVRDGKRTATIFSPSGKESFHVVEHFGRLEVP